MRKLGNHLKRIPKGLKYFEKEEQLTWSSMMKNLIWDIISFHPEILTSLEVYFTGQNQMGWYSLGFPQINHPIILNMLS